MKSYLPMIFGAALMASAAFAQEKKSVSPPPKPADDGPSLEVTMKFIQKQLNGQGTVSRIITTQQGSPDDFDPFDRKGIHNLWEAVADANTCQLSWTQSEETPDGPYFETNINFSLKDVSKLDIATERDVINRQNVKSGHPELVVTAVNPPVSVLVVHMSDGNTVHWHTRSSEGNKRDGSSSFTEILFGEDELADRVAKAMVHAVEQCGGGEAPEPF